ncbi:hypothetical protein LAZ67_X003904, partial [Cordylochernes scorpioides]
MENRSEEHTKLKYLKSVKFCRRYSCPYMPEIPGLDSFEGIVMHSHDYRHPDPFTDLKVIVLGAGPSGVDIAIELSRVANEVVISHNLQPGYNGPLPSNVVQEEGIASVHPHYVVFLNGHVHEAQAIVLCTGYKLSFPFIHESCKLRFENGVRVYPLYKHVINCYYPSMALIGILYGILPFPIFHQQVLFFMSVVRGGIILPPTDLMIADVDNDYRLRITTGIPPRHAHKMTRALLWSYDDQLSRMGGFPPISPIIRHLFDLVGILRQQNFLTFKNHLFRLASSSSDDRIRGDRT